MSKSSPRRLLVLMMFGLTWVVPSFSQTIAPKSQTDTLYPVQDSVLRIVNLSPYFTLHVDSTMNYGLEINKNPTQFYWYLKNSPLGLKINKDNGVLTFKA